MMRRLMCLLCLLLAYPVMAAADSVTVTFTPMPEAEASRFLQNALPVLWTEDYADRPIQCFDVREDGVVALGFNRKDGKYAVVLDRDGAFQYGLAFRATGSFLLRWMEDGLGVIWIRSEAMGVFDETGKCVGLYGYEPDRAFSRYSDALRRPSRTVGGYTYTLHQAHPLALNYGRLVRVDAQGNEMILHDASVSSALSAVGVLIVMAFVTICIIVSLRRWGKATRI